MLSTPEKSENLFQKMHTAPAAAPTSGKKQREKRIFFSDHSTLGIGIAEYIANAIISEYSNIDMLLLLS